MHLVHKCHKPAAKNIFLTCEWGACLCNTSLLGRQNAPRISSRFRSITERAEACLCHQSLTKRAKAWSGFTQKACCLLGYTAPACRTAHGGKASITWVSHQLFLNPLGLPLREGIRIKYRLSCTYSWLEQREEVLPLQTRFAQPSDVPSLPKLWNCCPSQATRHCLAKSRY